MHVLSIMTRDPVTISPSATVDEAMAEMERLGVRHLPVVTGGRIEGIVSERDLLSATGWLQGAGPEVSGGPLVADIMSTNLKTATPDEEITSVVVELITDGIGGLPVVEDGALVGMVTEIDVIRAYVDAIRAGRVAEARDVAAGTIMTRDVLHVEGGQSLSEVVELCRSRHIRHLPVLQGGRLVALLSDRDLRRARGRGQLSASVHEVVGGSPLVMAAPTERVSVVAARMLSSRISAVPIVLDRSLVGICTTVDILDHCMNTLWEPEDGPNELA